MYLSKLVFDPAARATQKAIADVSYLHTVVMSGFPAVEGESPRESLGILYRMETLSRGADVQLLAQSRVKPDWERLPRGLLLADGSGDNPSCKPIDGLYENLTEDMRLRFRLKANPTRKVKSESGTPQGKRVELVKEEQQREWLSRKAELSGFEVISVAVRPDGKVTSAGRGVAASNRLTLFSVTFDGVLHVVDGGKFLVALQSGIGPGKAYGFGLLSVAP